MSTIGKQSNVQKSSSTLGTQRNYNEIIEFLDKHWSPNKDRELSNLKKLDRALSHPSEKVPAVFISGTNGKGLTIHFATKLFQEEGMAIGAFYSPHLLTYNERFVINNEAISNKAFTELANEVIATAESLNLKVNTLEILTMMALLHFKNNKVDLALLEMNEGNIADPVNICNPKIIAITRITNETLLPKNQKTNDYIKTMLECVRPGTYVVSADQSKLNLQVMLEVSESRSGHWAMPIRKLAQLPYPFEQLHGRCAALAERICQIYIDKYSNKEDTIVSNSLLVKQKGQRGRPTLKKKKELQENPRKTLEQFWKETINELPAHFQVLKEKPTILLDNARNIDAIKNLLLGIRLLHYQKPYKGIAFIFGCDKEEMNTEEFLRLLRYFAKKNSCHIIFCPIEGKTPGRPEASWSINNIMNDNKSIKIKARSAQNFSEAFEFATKSVDNRDGLVVIAGSQSIVTEYWHTKGIKKI